MGIFLPSRGRRDWAFLLADSSLHSGRQEKGKGCPPSAHTTSPLPSLTIDALPPSKQYHHHHQTSLLGGTENGGMDDDTIDIWFDDFPSEWRLRHQEWMGNPGLSRLIYLFTDRIGWDEYQGLMIGWISMMPSSRCFTFCFIYLYHAAITRRLITHYDWCHMHMRCARHAVFDARAARLSLLYAMLLR